MNRLNRRNFLWMVGAAGAAPSLAAARDLAGQAPGVVEAPAFGGRLTFRAVAPLPSQPLPAYASQVLAGHIDTATGSGMINQTVFAGGPAAMSEIALPGLSRSIRVTGVTWQEDRLLVTGVIDDRSQLHAGEDPVVHMQLDQGRGLLSAEFLGSPTQLELVG